MLQKSYSPYGYKSGAPLQGNAWSAVVAASPGGSSEQAPILPIRWVVVGPFVSGFHLVRPQQRFGAGSGVRVRRRWLSFPIGFSHAGGAREVV